jgi:hypothetical protein
MIGQLLPNTNEMLQCILAIQILYLNTARAIKVQLYGVTFKMIFFISFWSVIFGFFWNTLFFLF